MGGADSFLASLGEARMVFDLDAFARLLAALDFPERRIPALHVAGTNGKGSVCAMAEAVLRGHGEHTGLYTSPHLDHPRERLAIDGEAIALDRFEGEVVALRDRLAHAAEATGYSYFDFLTALAFTLFAAESVSAAVVETGLGGRLDSTRLCQARVACITPIDFDHTAILGDTLAAIAREKAGILRPGGVAVVAPQVEEVAEVVAGVAGACGCTLLRFGHEFGAEVSGTRGGTPVCVGHPVDGAAAARTWRYHSLSGTTLELPMPLLGDHQVVNGACALACVEAFRRRPLDPERTAAALAGVRWPGRLEWIGDVLVDGAHNVAGARVLGAYLRAQKRPIRLLWGMLRDKDAAGFFAALGVRPVEVILPRLAAPRGRTPETLVELLPPALPYRLAETVAEGLAMARGDGETRVCVTGSLTLVGEARRLLLTPAAHAR
ncbi:MAG TPA: bifunctional folylpolyglutamate synthase/dihydrofolate synthase [Proteobacteria bacterium]|nr:MAG: bifunctional folylpolyglutamate synthase/dihydrofolate synthase [Nitrospirae bacterium CG06_land_8_20_14_3_00_70_43]PIX82622.1 MAG: bifunctional folylpolyglutamate synthase/dihydrofolate synthase [Nitrospirae bacterium CG_4_10_14_3_um_filter_70_108]PJB94909.1 MAG: bifunctional folylpolyglutamate synthase/dihydrofolate synthase [Nitrospirae bacterium CG_4_9_14_0_8_um_filter_70_14]HBB40927.1 bifunctional folylpolyglutamate synthase/dihydrofolate synthase [Pseudomonadota bacterium]